MARKRAWANGRTLMHNGSNTMFYVVVWMAPDKTAPSSSPQTLGWMRHSQAAMKWREK
jgi:hypothetical protein